MLRRLSLIAGLAAALAASPALAAGDAAAGLQAMKDYNLIVLGNWTTGHDVEGRTLITGSMSGNSGSLGIGSSANPTQGASASNAPTLTVGGSNNSSNMNISNGSNGGSGKVSNAPGVAIWGDSKGFNDNISGPDSFVIGNDFSDTVKANVGDSWKIGHDATNGINLDGGSVQLGNSYSGNLNNNSGTLTYVPGLKTTLQSAITSTVTTVRDDVKALSTTLAGMTVVSPSSFNISGTTLTLNAVNGGSGFALATLNLNSVALGSFTTINYNLPGGSMPVIINVFGGTDPNTQISFKANNGTGFDDSANQRVIWNFVEARNLKFTTEFHGSILAPYALVENTTPIEGTLVAGTYVQNGEVHLGTFKGDVPLQPVPEPATWAMMIGGFALVGSALRRNKIRASIRFA